MPTRLALACLMTLLVAACGGTTEPATPDADGGATDDPAGSWVLRQAEPPLEVPTGARITLDVTAEGGVWQVGGTAACNSYGGTVVTDDHGWRAEGYAVTEMGCPGPRMAAEQAYLDALVTIDTWSRPSRDVLVLTGPDVRLEFEALPPVPTAELTGTVWVLDGLVAGVGPDAGVSSTTSSTDEAVLRLDSDGTVEASTGCRTFSGEWIQSGDEVELTTFGERDDSPNVAGDGTITCDEQLVAQEDHVLSVLGDGFRARVDGDRLTLTSRDGLGLIYRTTDDPT